MSKYNYEDYKAALEGRNPANIDATKNTDDYYNALKNESYKSLLNSEVQASIARDQALKYTNNSLMSKGYANQGIAESTNLGIQSQYSNALANAVNNYQSSIKDINAQHRAEQLANQNDEFESVTSLMSGATDKDQLNNILTTYKYIGDDGKFNTAEFNKLDPNSQKQLQILYSMYNSQFDTSSTNKILDSVEALSNQTYIKDVKKDNGKDKDKKGDGTVSTLGENFGEEIKLLDHHRRIGTYIEGDVIKVKNGQNEEIYLQYTNGGFKMVGENEYKAAGTKYNLTYGKKNTTHEKA